MLYHTNFGPPLLEEGAKFLAPVEKVTPFNDHAAKDVRAVRRVRRAHARIRRAGLQPCAPGRSQWRHARDDPQQGRRSGRVDAVRHPRAAVLDPLEEHGCGEDGYVTGIEPGTNYPNNRRIEAQARPCPQPVAGG